MARPPKGKAIERLNKAIDEIADLSQRRNGSPEFEKWHRNTEIAIANTFGEKSRHVKDFTDVYYSVFIMSDSTPDSAFQEAYIRGLESAKSVLQSMVEEVEEYWENESPTKTLANGTKKRLVETNDVFIIHGRDDGAKETVARFITKLGLNPIILHEQSNRGRTIIEKFERHAHVAFAIALLTPDDTGGLVGDESLKPRARQNVIFEFGYFMGKLGRNCVCALTKGNVEIPSDYAGILYIPLDISGAWKMSLVKELKDAGFNVDANLAL